MDERNEVAGLSQQDKIQWAAFQAWQKAGCRGTLEMSTGSGKSWVFLLGLSLAHETWGDKLKALLVVPTEELRDENWPTEARLASVGELWDKYVTAVCYKSLHKLTGHYHYVGLDEVHHITEANSEFLYVCTYDWMMGMTATTPGRHNQLERDKRAIIDRFAPVCYRYTLDQGVKDEVNADYKLYIIQKPIDRVKKVIQAGPKGDTRKQFMITEEMGYQFRTRMLQQAIKSGNKQRIKFAALERYRFVGTLPSKTELARALMLKIMQQKPEARVLIFCASIEQAEELLPGQTFHSETSNKNLRALKDREIDWLAVVESVDEGHNIPDMDIAIIVRLNSNSRRLVQRIGRIVRFRPGHEGIIFALSTTGTQDEKWLESSTEDIARSRIFYLPHTQVE